MIVYKNLKKHKSLAKKDQIYNIFSGEEKDICKSIYNLVFENQTLKTGAGFKDLQVPASEEEPSVEHGFDLSEISTIKNIYLHRRYSTDYQTYRYNLYMIDDNNYLYKIFLIDPYFGTVMLDNKKLKEYPSLMLPYRIENEDCALFFTQQGMLFSSNTAEYTVTNMPAMISCVVHYDNFFGITTKDRNVLVYTKNLNLTTWTDSESSTIEFMDNRGAFTKLVSFNDYVYLFREYGITKISVYTSKSEFSFTHLYTSTSKIYEESICVCGEKVLFLTRDGLYSFNGSSVDKVGSRFDEYLKDFDNTNVTSACLDGKYYVCTRCNFDDDDTVGCENQNHVNNVMFALDVETFDLMLYRGVDVKTLIAVRTPVYSKLLACFNGDNHKRVGQLDLNGSTFETINQKAWKSQETDLGYAEKTKRIKEFSVVCKYPIDVEIISEQDSVLLHFLGSEKSQKMPVNICGKTFKFNFITTQQYCNVKKPCVAFDVQA